MGLADVSIRRPVFAWMMIAALVVFGIVAYPKIGVDLFPNVEFPVVTITVVYPGADPATMESKVADKVEEAVNSIAGIKTLRSVNVESVSQIIVEFNLDVKTDSAMQEIRDRVSAITNDLPKGIDPPKVQKFDVGAAPIMSIALAGNLPVRELTEVADDVVKERLQRLKGVGQVDLVGDRDREIKVRLKPSELAGKGLTAGDVVQAIGAQNLELPAGKIHAGQHELTLTTKGEIRSVDQLRDLVITSQGGATIHLSDVADVEDSQEDASSYSAMSGKQALALVVTKQSGSNSVEVSKLVRAELIAMKPLLDKAGVAATVPTDQAPFIEHSIEDVQFDLVFGAALAVLIILFFLHDFRATIISAIALPTAVIATFAFVQVMGFTFNNMTMLALSLSIGILIDDAIVVIENIHRHLEMGKPPIQAAADATKEIGLAVVATTFSIVAVFFPVAVMKGIVGRFFFQFGLTVSFAVLVSLLVAFTLTPMLSSRWLRSSHGKKLPLLARPIEWFLRGIERVYKRILGWALRHRAITLIVAIIALFSSCALAGKVKAEFLPPQDRAQFRINVELPVGTSLEATSEYTQLIADDMKASMPGVTDTFVTVGDGAQNQVNLGKIQVLLKKRTERAWGQEDAMAWARERYKDVKDATITVEMIGDIEGGGFKNAPIQYNIRGKDPAKLEAAAKAMMDALRKEKGFVDVDSSFRGGKPQLEITPNRERAAAMGVPVALIATTVRYLVAGDKVSELKEGLDAYDITVGLPEADKDKVANLANLQVRGASGAPVDLANVVDVKQGEGPSQIDRQSRSRQITVYANLEGVPLGEATKIVDRIAKQVIPAELDSDYAGMGQVMVESFGYMFQALILAIIIVYMILAAQFNSFIHPLTIMLSLPMAVVGAFGGLYITGMTLNIFSFIGLIMLMGLVTKNAILLVDYANHQVDSGKSTKEALMIAGPVRLRPILMTTAAMIFGMLPVALALGEGGEQRAPMAVTVMGGLITSTVLTLVVVPVVYSLFEGARHRIFKKKYAAKEHPPSEPEPV